MEPPEVRTEFLFELRIAQKDLYELGDTPYGQRTISTPRPGSRVEGPRLKGTVLEGGGDPFLVRTDGVGEIDARLTLRTDDGALILMRYRGLWVATLEVQEAILRGESVPVHEYRVCISATFETGSPEYQWLNAIFGIGYGFIPDDIPHPSMGYRVYALE